MNVPLPGVTVRCGFTVLTLGVAGLAMFASLMTLSGMRLPQLAPVWAMGLTRRHLAWLVLCARRPLKTVFLCCKERLSVEAVAVLAVVASPRSS